MTSPAEASIDLPARPESIRQARRLVAGTLAGVAPDTIVDDLTLAASELVTNAIEHGPTALSDTVHVAVSVTGSAARVTIRSAADHRLRDAAHWAMPDAEAVSGRGLGIVRQLSDSVHIERLDGIIAITLERNW